ncbi:ATP-binding protein [Corynebacterium yudongzhengii]|uniref:PspC domain-containing protein n=1 Tax=Corynebacterium yudongzhengii TaxID=2080740 RepID=A0A2U1T6X4_9CORY|nr:PspC domain-containing protein [Corynebacterium yudongzhengii]AWB81317.1 ATP-binding protein [Corynebacterium yudongzhengii]PWC01760.1 PspC domain-containing protein [Corynebacterium yudongzhengii]
MPSSYSVPSGPAYPTLVRPERGRAVAGVAAGVASQLRIDVLYVRLAFVVMTVFSGLGAWAYGGLWIFTHARSDAPAPPSRHNLPRSVNLVLAGVAVATVVGGSWVLTTLPAAVIFALVMAGVGGFLAWMAYDRGTSSANAIVFFVVGAVLVVGGLGLSIWWWESGGMAGTLAAVLLTLAGVAVLAGPAVVRLWESEAASRAQKVAAEERADIASRLHDSVLQTLALIQKRAEDPEEVARLARQQERELRGWLFAPEDAHAETTVFAALKRAGGEVEDMFGLRVSCVTVGEDKELNDASKAVVLAAREAMVNAAKHAGVDTLDVYGEYLAGELAIFVRDRGCGFELEAVGEDRHGIRDSIQARVERAGGAVQISSTPGEGTEVEITLP